MQRIFLLNFAHINKCLFKLKINEISLKLLNLNRNLINKPTEWYGKGMVKVMVMVLYQESLKYLWYLKTIIIVVTNMSQSAGLMSCH